MGQYVSNTDKLSKIKKLNERMRKTVEKLGTKSPEYRMWLMKIRGMNIPTTEVYDEKGNTFYLISRKKDDIANIKDDDLSGLEVTTTPWKETRDRYIRKYNKQNPNTPITPGDVLSNPQKINDEIRELAEMTEAIRSFTELYGPEIYLKLTEGVNGWDDIHEHTTKEIYEKYKDIIESNNAVWNDPVAMEEARADYYQRKMLRERKRKMHE